MLIERYIRFLGYPRNPEAKTTQRLEHYRKGAKYAKSTILQRFSLVQKI